MVDYSQLINHLHQFPKSYRRFVRLAVMPLFSKRVTDRTVPPRRSGEDRDASSGDGGKRTSTRAHRRVPPGLKHCGDTFALALESDSISLTRKSRRARSEVISIDPRFCRQQTISNAPLAGEKVFRSSRSNHQRAWQSWESSCLRGSHGHVFHRRLDGLSSRGKGYASDRTRP